MQNDSLSTEPVVLKEEVDGIVTLTLNRPLQYNALSSDMLTTLQESLDEIEANASVRVVIIAANGRAFCAGHDLKELRSRDEFGFHQALFEQCGRLMLSIHHLSQPVIAQVDGIATAAGCQLVASCDLAIASDASRFAVSGINVGLFCSTPAVPLSRNIPRKQAMRMLLSGDFISAQKAQEFGLINEAVPVEALAEKTGELARKIASKSSHAIQLGKQVFYKQLGMELEDAYAYTSERMACNMDSEDAREGIDAFIEKRKPVWKHG